MSTTYVCDYCGDIIAEERERAAVHAIGWASLGDYHRSPCLGFVKQAVEDACGSPVGRVTPEEQRRSEDDRWRWWERQPRHIRHRLVLEALGERALTARQVAERIEREHPEGALYANQMTYVLKQLLEAGEVQREPEQFQKKLRYRWSRKTDLTGPIAGLQRQLDEAKDA